MHCPVALHVFPEVHAGHATVPEHPLFHVPHCFPNWLQDFGTHVFIVVLHFPLLHLLMPQL
jgi:hypothetical protein